VPAGSTSDLVDAECKRQDAKDESEKAQGGKQSKVAYVSSHNCGRKMPDQNTQVAPSLAREQLTTAPKSLMTSANESSTAHEVD
jgi:hypothetical protein